jgi:hypothetical protein
MSNFDFKIPNTAKIKGVLIQVKLKQVNVDGFGSNYEVYDDTVKLISAGRNLNSANKASSSRWPSTLTTRKYGGNTDLWGIKLTPAIMNVSGFGLAIRARHPTNKHPFLYIDCVQVTVYYEEGTTTPTTPSTPTPKPPSLAAKPGHTIKITDPSTGNQLGFYAEAPEPAPDYPERNLEEVEIENSYPKFYPTNYKYQRFTFKVSLQGVGGSIGDWRNQLLTIVNKPVHVVSWWGYNFTSWVTYKPGYKNGHPHAMFLEFTVQRIA